MATRTSVTTVRTTGADKRAAYSASSKKSRVEKQMGYRSSIIDRSPAAMVTSMAYRQTEEKKFCDFGDGDTELIPNPVGSMGFLLLNTPLVGAAFFNRIGNKITMKSVHIKINIGPRIPTTTPGGQNETVRFMLIYDRQANGANPTPATLLTDYGNGGGTQTTIISGMNPTQTGRFVILREHFIKLFNVNNETDMTSAASSFYQQDDHWFVNWFVKLKDLETIYQASTGGIGDVSNGALYLVNMTDATAAAQSACIFKYKARLRFMG